MPSLSSEILIKLFVSFGLNFSILISVSLIWVKICFNLVFVDLEIIFEMTICWACSGRELNALMVIAYVSIDFE